MPHVIAPAQLVDFVVHEAHLLDTAQYAAWNALFADDGLYWIPATPGQTDPALHNSHLLEDAFLRRLRVDRLASPRAFSQQPPSRCLHVLQTPVVVACDAAGGHYATRTPFHYSEARGDAMLTLVGTARHTFRVDPDGALRIVLKRVDLLAPDAALPAVELFP
ncbi:MAG: phenylpropionate dioxygenase [Burkholderiales bacterium]|jgi:3-phenylpropionate/cinnamic acid dioxygenase small subunit|nr:phenylpropionate dioxygenase [Burkholderiales bacterium]